MIFGKKHKILLVDDDEDEIFARHLGVVDYIRKPIQKKDLLKKVETALSSVDSP
jgi:DNA-binding response OmpR family regulator